MFQSLDLRPASLPAGHESTEERFVRLKKEIHKQLITGLHMPSVGTADDYELRRELRRGIEQLCEDRTELMSQEERKRLINEVIDETLGLGAHHRLFGDTT